MVETGYLTNQFHIATPYLLDPGFFFKTLPTFNRRNDDDAMVSSAHQIFGEMGRT